MLERRVPLAFSVSVAWARGIAAPVESVTFPVRVAPPLWLKAEEEKNVHSERTTARERARSFKMLTSKECVAGWQSLDAPRHSGSAAAVSGFSFRQERYAVGSTVENIRKYVEAHFS